MCWINLLFTFILRWTLFINSVFTSHSKLLIFARYSKSVLIWYQYQTVCVKHCPALMIMKEGNVLFTAALNTFYLWSCGIRHRVKDYFDGKRRNPLPPLHGLLVLISKGSFICKINDRIIHTTSFVKPVVEHWLEWKIAQGVHNDNECDEWYNGQCSGLCPAVTVEHMLK